MAAFEDCQPGKVARPAEVDAVGLAVEWILPVPRKRRGNGLVGLEVGDVLLRERRVADVPDRMAAPELVI